MRARSAKFSKEYHPRVITQHALPRATYEFCRRMQRLVPRACPEAVVGLRTLGPAQHGGLKLEANARAHVPQHRLQGMTRGLGMVTGLRGGQCGRKRKGSLSFSDLGDKSQQRVRVAKHDQRIVKISSQSQAPPTATANMTYLGIVDEDVSVQNDHRQALRLEQRVDADRICKT